MHTPTETRVVVGGGGGWWGRSRGALRSVANQGECQPCLVLATSVSLLATYKSFRPDVFMVVPYDTRLLSWLPASSAPSSRGQASATAEAFRPQQPAEPLAIKLFAQLKSPPFWREGNAQHSWTPQQGPQPFGAMWPHTPAQEDSARRPC
ncbi:hypothetical protein WJX82_006199 [Trebouxia sp. C0006]